MYLFINNDYVIVYNIIYRYFLEYILAFFLKLNELIYNLWIINI